jgi:hypothetical protein
MFETARPISYSPTISRNLFESIFMYMLLSDGQLSNIWYPIALIDCGIWNDVRESHDANAYSPIPLNVQNYITESMSFSCIDVKFLHLANA